MPQARIVDPAAPWIIRPAITPAPLEDSAISAQDAMNRPRPARKITPPAEHVAQRTRRHDHRAPTSM